MLLQVSSIGYFVMAMKKVINTSPNHTNIMTTLSSKVRSNSLFFSGKNTRFSKNMHSFFFHLLASFNNLTVSSFDRCLSPFLIGGTSMLSGLTSAFFSNRKQGKALAPKAICWLGEWEGEWVGG